MTLDLVLQFKNCLTFVLGKFIVTLTGQNFSKTYILGSKKHAQKRRLAQIQNQNDTWNRLTFQRPILRGGKSICNVVRYGIYANMYIFIFSFVIEWNVGSFVLIFFSLSKSDLVDVKFFKWYYYVIHYNIYSIFKFLLKKFFGS